MKWIYDEDGGYVNLDSMEHIYLEDWGLEFTERYRVYACVSGREYLIRRFCVLKSAKDFRDSLVVKII